MAIFTPQKDTFNKEVRKFIPYIHLEYIVDEIEYKNINKKNQQLYYFCQQAVSVNRHSLDSVFKN